jgi:hypothetical protein
MEESNDRIWNQKHNEQIKSEKLKTKSGRPLNYFSSLTNPFFFMPCN